MSSEVFTTLPRVVSDAAITFEKGKYFNSTELAESDPEKYGNLPRDYGVLNYTLAPNGSAAHWYSCFYPTSDYATMFDDDTLILFLVDYGYNEGQDGCCTTT